MGSEGAFEPGVYDITTTWAATSVIVNLIASVVGGIVCVLIARKSTAAIAFSLIVLGLGLVVAIPVLMADDAERAARPEGVSMVDAMKEARQPVWFALLNPFLAAGGIMVGASLVRGKSQSQR